MSSLGAFLFSVSLILGGKPQLLKSWSNTQELSHFKTVSSREKDPATGKLAHWKGILLSEVLDQALSTVPLDQKARFDLIILTSASGKQAFIPRSLIQKFPLLLASQRDSHDLAGIQVVIPWTSHPRVLTEEYLPLEDYFIPELKKVELASYADRYASIRLKRRTDPSAMRGEKIFIQNCMGCHGSGDTPYAQTISHLSAGAARALAASSGATSADSALGGHPKAPGVKHFKERDRRAILSFLEAYQSENAAQK